MKTKFAAVGDAIIQRHMPSGGYPGFEAVHSIIQDADASIFNLETTVHKYESYGSQYSGGGYFCSDPSILKDLKEFGFSATTFANNHTMDYSLWRVNQNIRLRECSRDSFSWCWQEHAGGCSAGLL